VKAIARRSLFGLNAMALLMAALIVIGAFNPTLAYLGVLGPSGLSFGEHGFDRMSGSIGNPLLRQAT
jgi:hypothetical protein